MNSAAPTPPESWFHYLSSDPQVVGIVTWVGFVLTVGGLFLAYLQLRKIKRSSEAASGAIHGMVRLVRSHERSARVADAFNFLTSAQAMIGQNNLGAASVNLLVSWKALIAARTLTDDDPDHEKIGEYVVAVRRLLDDVSMPGITLPLDPAFVAARHVELSKTLSDVGSLSTKMQTQLSGMGPVQ